MALDTRGKVLKAAEKVFERRGLAGATMQEVAEAAGVGRATLYRHFGSMKDVLSALVLSEANELFAIIDTQIEGGEDTSVLLERTLPTVAEFLLGHRLLQKVFRKEPELVLPYLTIHSQGLLVAAVEFMTPHIERTVKARNLKVDPRIAAEWAARIILSLLTTPSVVADLRDPKHLRSYLAPILDSFADQTQRRTTK